jgi:hypothetical protein
MDLTRRRLLGIGLVGTAALALAGVGLGLRPGVETAPQTELLVLTPTQFSVLAALSVVVCPGDDALPDARHFQVAEKLDATLATVHPGLAAELGQALLLLENALAGAFLEGRITPFTACTRAEQTEIWNSWARSDLALRRTVFKGLTGLITATYWSHQELWAAIDYPGPPTV